MNFILNGLVEIPIVVVCIFIMDHVGRKILIIINMVLLTGVCCVPAGFASTSVKTALVLVGKLYIIRPFRHNRHMLVELELIYYLYNN